MTTGYRYPMRKCPYCGKHYANVKNHILMKHGSGATELTADALLGHSSPDPEPGAPAAPEFFCTNCGAFVKRGDRECWRCGEALAWERV